ncbi:unnamed protein product [Onchocerca flexuosa]|uniref:Rab-GAP TBC domain-containing protein n=1 Tax=Onchocerca flexuosa TaxID=387005 RepID=A0A183H3F3_9BILA|nr:unnamed protein product [Onchocerca flexuosa]
MGCVQMIMEPGLVMLEMSLDLNKVDTFIDSILWYCLDVLGYKEDIGKVLIRTAMCCKGFGKPLIIIAVISLLYCHEAICEIGVRTTFHNDLFILTSLRFFILLL